MKKYMDNIMGEIKMDLVTIGETMVLFTTESSGYMRHTLQFSSKIGGSESNVAIALSRLGYNTGWISKLGDDEFGKKIMSFIRGEKVNVNNVSISTSNPTGIYFKELFSEEETRIFYYRHGSAASTLNPSDLNEQYISSSKFLYLTGITPALSNECYKTTLKAIEIAQTNNVKVIFDPNIRLKLWSKEKARQVLLELIQKSDIVLPGISEAKLLTGKDRTEDMASYLKQMGPSKVVIKLGKDGAYYLSDQESGFVTSVPVKKVIDPVGAGDAFNAGFISGLLDGLPMHEAVSRGNVLGAIVVKINGDVEGLPDKEKLDFHMKKIKNGFEDVER